MARFFKTGSTSWNNANSWSATGAGGVDNAGVPTAADDVIFEAASGNCTIDVTPALCRSLDCTSGTGAYAGTLTHNAATVLTIGDGTPGPGNVALKFSAGMTYTKGNSLTSAITFLSTSATAQGFTWAGKVSGNVIFSGTGGSWTLQDAWAAPLANIVLTRGTLNTNGQTCSWSSFNSSNTNTRTLTLGASSITVSNNSVTSWDLTTTTNLTFNANTSTITLSGSVSTFAGGGLTYNNVVLTGAGQITLSGAGNTYANLTRTGTAVKTDSLQIGHNHTITGTFTVTGNSTINRVLVFSSVPGVPHTFTAAVVALTNVDFQDVTGAGAASPFTGTSLGDALGNSGITFPAPTTQTHTASAGGNWSDVTKWTSRVPLPQDNVIVDVNTTGTLTADMPRLGANLTFTGFVGTFSINSTTNTMYGNLILAAGMTFSGGNQFGFFGRGSNTITSAGKTFGGSVNVSNPGGTYTLQDALVAAGTMLINDGTFTSNNFAVTALTYSIGSRAVTVNMGTSTWTSTTTAAASFWSVGTPATISGASATIVLSTASANTRTFVSTNRTYGTLTYTVAGSTGQLSMSGPNVFGTINFSDASNARTLAFAAGFVVTILTAFNVFGTPGKLMTVTSSTAATHTLSKSGYPVSADYLSVDHSIATGGAPWYAGANSTDGGSNTGWAFTPPRNSDMLMAA